MIRRTTEANRDIEKETQMSRDVLIISTMDGAENCARLIAEQVGAKVEVASSRRAGLALLRQRNFGVVVVEESLAEADPEWADHVWEQAGLAMPVQLNFAIAGCARLGREVKAAMLRSQGEKAVARRAAAWEIENDLKSSAAGKRAGAARAGDSGGAGAQAAPPGGARRSAAGAAQDRGRD
jgi:DNA-binding NtrC family response regulator